MQVLVTLRIEADPQAQPHSLWNKFFDAHETVAYVEWEGTAQGCTDVTVYFKDSKEPFPLTSLRADSKLREALEEICL